MLCLAVILYFLTPITYYEYQSLRSEISLKAAELHVTEQKIDGYLRKHWNFSSTKEITRFKYKHIMYFLKTPKELPNERMLLYFRKKT